MMINIAICEDSKNEVDQLNKYLIDFQFQNNIDINKEIFETAEKLLNSYQKGKYHILFLDIELPGMNGIDLAKKIRQIPDKDVYIVYTSNYPKYMSNGYDVKAFHFLQKPIDYPKLSEVLMNILNEYQDNTSVMSIHTGRNSSIVTNIKDIVYIETSDERNHVIFHLIDKDVDGIHHINKLEELLKPHHFLLANRSTLVNMKYVTGFSQDKLMLRAGIPINLGRNYKEQIYDFFTEEIVQL
ncbi:MAG: response regulator transcription factor [Lachnospiraceae bacterium]|nr:response regulator transcription factor [Lachnospiraceae bacterium]